MFFPPAVFPMLPLSAHRAQLLKLIRCEHCLNLEGALDLLIDALPLEVLEFGSDTVDLRLVRFFLVYFRTKLLALGSN